MQFSFKASHRGNAFEKTVVWSAAVFYISFWEKNSPLVEIRKFCEINEISKKEFKNFDQIWSLVVILFCKI
jgi:hypothetical protein